MKTFKEHLGINTIRVGGLDAVHPIASMGKQGASKPPKGKGSKSSRAVGLVAGLEFTDRDKAVQSINKLRTSGKSNTHQVEAAITMSQRAKVASERAKDPETQKDLSAAHRVYQIFVNTSKLKE